MGGKKQQRQKETAYEGRIRAGTDFSVEEPLGGVQKMDLSAHLWVCEIVQLIKKSGPRLVEQKINSNLSTT